METANKDEIVIRTVDLCKTYGTLKAVDHLNLEIRRGEIFGLLGPNGAGKTTTTLMLLGLTDPTSGSASIGGLDCTRDSLAVKNEVGYLPDNVGFYPNMSGRDNLIFSGEMNGLTREQAGERAKQVLEKVGMTEAADRDAGTYSRGMRQRLGIADVLMKQPRIIIMDEPTGGLDPQATLLVIFNFDRQRRRLAGHRRNARISVTVFCKRECVGSRSREADGAEIAHRALRCVGRHSHRCLVSIGRNGCSGRILTVCRHREVERLGFRQRVAVRAHQLLHMRRV